jgi:hypothetical protein
MNRKIYCLILTLIVLVSCTKDEKKEYITNLDSFVTETTENYKDFDDDDWEKADDAFLKLRNDEYPKYKQELTPEESKRINELIGKYAALRVKDGILDFKSSVNDLMQQADSFVKEMESDTTLLKIDK